MEVDDNFDALSYLENDKICIILQDSYRHYNLDFKKEVLVRYYTLKQQNVETLKQVINEVCRDMNSIVSDFFNNIS